MTEPSPVTSFPVSVTIPVRFRDLDGLGHVNNAVFATYLEVGRENYWRRLGRGWTLEDLPFILARLECDFRAPIPYGGAAVVRVGCPRVGTKSWDFLYRIEAEPPEDGSEPVLYAEAFSVQVYYDYENQRAVPIPESFRKGIEALEAGEPV